MHAAAHSTGADLPADTRAIALAATSEAHLCFIEAKLRRAGIRHCAIREPDAPWSGALMAIGFAPVANRDVVRPITGSLRLLQ
jgi:hypothetical protein